MAFDGPSLLDGDPAWGLVSRAEGAEPTAVRAHLETALREAACDEIELYALGD